jgi:Lar family restriction alleviation protein
MDKRELERLQRDALSDAFANKDLSGLSESLPKNPEFKKRIDPCPFCGGEVETIATENNLLMNGAWRIDCNNCDVFMREDFVLGKEKKKAETIILKRWNNRKI